MADWDDREQGYVKLYRRMLSSDLMQDPHLLQLFLYCLMRATYTERSVSVKVGRGVTQVQLQPGQMVYGRISSARDLGQPTSSTWSRMKRLAKLGRVTLDCGAHFTIVTICNWATYQQDQCEQEAEPAPPPVKKAKDGIFAYDGFDAFWSAYPDCKRKYAKSKCREKWRAKGLANRKAEVMDGLARWKRTDEWTKDGGAFIPAPEVWLNQERWEAPVDGADQQIVLGVSTC